MLVEIGGGRKTSNDKIDPSCGLYLNKKINDKINVGEPIIEIFGNNKNKIDSVEKIFDNIIFISNEKNNEEKQIIYE